MEFRIDIPLKHNIWQKMTVLRDDYKIFNRNADIFILALSIGIADDEIVDCEEVIGEGKSIPRTVMANYDINHHLTFLYQNAILSSKHVSLDIEERKKVAFGQENIDSKYSPSNFLIKYANYGMIKISECITNHDIETIHNLVLLIKNYKDKSSIMDVDLEVLDI